MGRFVARNEIHPQLVIGSANPIRKTDSVIFPVTNLAHHFENRFFMARFAVHDHAVHIEDDGLNLLRLTHREVDPSCNRRSNWVLLTGETERRDCLSKGRSFNPLSAFIATSVTGSLNPFTGAISTADQSPSVDVGSEKASLLTFAIPTICFSLTL